MNTDYLENLLKSEIGKEFSPPVQADRATRRRMTEALLKKDDKAVAIAIVMSLFLLLLEAFTLSLILPILQVLVFAGLQLSLISLAVSYGILRQKTKAEVSA